MSCNKPVRIWMDRDGKRSREMGAARRMDVPCGWCSGCRMRRAQDWAVRAVHEAATARCSSFITLTFSDENLPLDGSVRVRDWQLFAKRLRKMLGPFRFMACGEYGSVGYRPHYHACLFGQDFAFDRKVHSQKKGYQLWRSPTLEKLWPYGYSTIGNLTFETAAYTARYVMKKAFGKNASRAPQYLRGTDFRTWYVEPEFVVTSRRPGLGSEWFEKYHSDVYPCDYVIVDGKKFRPPRFYDKKFAEMDPETFEVIQEKRQEHAVQASWKEKTDGARPKWKEREVRERVETRKSRAARRDVA